MSTCSALLTMLPALAFAATMLVRPYLGQRAIARLRLRRAAPSPLVRAACEVGAHRRAQRTLSRGGLLIAAALAGRAPPAALAPAS
jgi:hypothetical protein